MRKLEDITQKLQQHKEKLSREYGVIQIGVFGSFVTGTQDQGSDLDILVEFNRPVDLLTFVGLKNYLSDLLGVKVDLVMKKALKPRIGQRILKEVVYL